MTTMWAKLSRRDRIALGIAGAAALLFALFNFGVLPLLDRLGVAPEALQQKEAELRQNQRLVTQAKLETTQFFAAQDRLKRLEGGLLESSLPYVATAEWQRLVRQLADSRGIKIGSSEFLRIQDLGAGYSLVTGRVDFNCRLDQLVDFLVGVASSPKLLSATSLRVLAPQGDPQGLVHVQLTIGAAGRNLQPAKDAAATAQ
jgi:hypothetical protein